MRCPHICLVLILVGIFPNQVSGQPCAQANNLIQAIQKNHVQPIPLDNSWSLRVFNGFFNELDPYHLYFTQQDTAQFKAQRIALDDLVLKQEHCKWIASVTELFKKRVTDYNLWLEQSLGQPYDYTLVEQFDALHFPSKNFPETILALERNRKSYLKFQILMRTYLESVADSSGKPLLTYEVLARKKVKAKELQKVTNLEHKGFENYIGTSFLKAIAQAYDPHTSYLSASEHDDLNASLSDENLSFGFTLKENEAGVFMITNIIPGAPAWNSNDFHENDILLGIEVSVEKTLNAMDYEIEELAEIIGSSELKTVAFTLKKPDGRIVKSKLTKEKVRSIENTVSGYVLSGTKKIGYIPLPSFYFDRTATSTGGCANDVAKAIIKLNTEKIEGLILDLRFNGGGSIDEARELAGIFIDFGPVIMYQQAGQPIAVLKDSNKGTVYNGPLIIMINGFSASASELLASSLQDHRRALIVGGRTFGKGTGQNILPVTGNKSAFAKVTTLKIYRINGRTYQHAGVLPDIMLPDLTQGLGDREADYPYALSSDSVAKKAYYTPAMLPFIPSLVEKSNMRVEHSAAFKDVARIKKIFQNPIPLNVTEFSQRLSNQQLTEKQNANLLTVTNPTFDASLLAVDVFRKELNRKTIQEIRESFYIHEAYQIMLDYISLKK